jgi:hypothetical protein
MEFFIIRDGQQTGPFNEETVRSLLQKGGVRAGDMAWRKGLPGWLPLNEVLDPGSERPTAPPPVGGVNSGVRARPASARQKALLKYLGAGIDEQASKEEAALAISDAFENPKFTSRLAKWGEEKLRLHPDLFQEEIDYRRANRVVRYLELCQTEGAEVVKDVTKAHVQVLMESLDKRNPEWERDPKAALWDYLLPSVSEHFPQLVHEEWKGKLKFGGTSKVAAAYASAAGTGILTPGKPAPGAVHAAVRGIVFGLLALGVVLGALYVFKDGKLGVDVARTNPSPAPAGSQPSKLEADQAGATVPAAAPHPTEAAAINPVADPGIVLAAANPAPAEPGAHAPAATGEPLPAPAAPQADPTMAANPPAATTDAPAAPTPANTFSSAPPPPGVAPVAPAEPAAPAAPAAPGPVTRSTATLTQRVTVQLQFGKVTLNPGTQVRLIAIEGQNARVNFNNNIVLVPVSATDVDPANTIVASVALPSPNTTVPIAPTALPATTTPTPAAPKPSPSSDL